MYAVASLGVAHLGVRTWAVGEGRNVSGLGLVSVFLSRAATEGGFAQGGLPSSLPDPPTDMLLLKKQTEDISSVYEIREKLGS